MDAVSTVVTWWLATAVASLTLVLIGAALVVWWDTHGEAAWERLDERWFGGGRLDAEIDTHARRMEALRRVGDDRPEWGQDWSDRLHERGEP